MSTFATFFWIDKDLRVLDQCCDHNCQSVDAVEGIQNGLMEQVSTLICRVDQLEAQSGNQCQCI